MICAACQSSDAALDVTLELANIILSGELPREAFLLDGLLIGLKKPGGGVRPIAISETWYRFAGVCALRIYGRGIYGRWPCPAAGGLGTPGGTETVAYALASALVEVPETGFISVDMANTFNSIHRAGECDRATPRVCCCLRSRCSLCWSGLMQCARRHRLCRTWMT